MTAVPATGLRPARDRDCGKAGVRCAESDPALACATPGEHPLHAFSRLFIFFRHQRAAMIGIGLETVDRLARWTADGPDIVMKFAGRGCKRFAADGTVELVHAVFFGFGKSPRWLYGKIAVMDGDGRPAVIKRALFRFHFRIVLTDWPKSLMG